MKLYEKLPDRITVGKKKVKVDLDFRNVLRMMEILSNDKLYPESREWLALKCICRRPVKGMFPPVKKLLFPEAGDHEKITDFEQDADLIISAFRQVYGIDLYRDRLHWIEFCCLLGCIPEGNRFSDVISIRTRPIPAATQYNTEERSWLIRAKAEVALKQTEAEQKASYAKGVRMLGSLLKSLAEKGD